MKEYARYAIGILFLIGAIILIVVGFNLIRNIFQNDNSEPQTQTTRSVNLIDAGKDGQPVRYTVNGAVVGNEDHRTIRITVDRNNRRIEILQGYSDQVIKSGQVPNTQAAYEAFIAALNGAGFTQQVQPEGRGNEAQVCAQGRKYAFEISPGASDAHRTWSTSCTRNEGTFGGNQSQIQRLFQRQIPDYDKFINDVRLT